MVSTAFEWLAARPQHLSQLDTCSVNLSGYSLGEEDLLEFISDSFESGRVPPEKICLEITETAAIANLSAAAHFIRTLKRLGCKFALDDFGSGLSSFAYLKNLPVDYLKIDGSFVRDIVTDEVDLAMVRSINELGHVLGKKTIAEFVENEAILAKLRELNVDYAQGYSRRATAPAQRSFVKGFWETVAKGLRFDRWGPVSRQAEGLLCVLSRSQSGPATGSGLLVAAGNQS